MSLEKLKIPEAPAAFAPFASRHNALADALAAMKGVRGIKVTVSEKNILIESDPNSNVASSNELHYDDGTVRIDIDGSGIVLTSGDFTVNVDPLNAEFVVSQGNNYVSIDSSDLQIYNATAAKTATLAFASITQDISLQTFVGCNNGNAANYLVWASDFF